MITIGDILGALFIAIWWLAVFVNNFAYILVGLIVCSVVANVICLAVAILTQNIDYLIASFGLSSAKVIAFCVLWFIVL